MCAYSCSVPLPVLQCFISDSQLTRDAALHLGPEDSFTFTLIHTVQEKCTFILESDERMNTVTPS